MVVSLNQNIFSNMKSISGLGFNIKTHIEIMIKKILLACFILITLCNTSRSQGEHINIHNPALFGTVNLKKGFEAVSHNVSVKTLPTEDIQVLNFCVGCQGYLGDVAVVELVWEGETDQLRVHFEPQKYGSDACLAVLTPNNEWLYSDNMDIAQDGPFLYLYGYNSGRYKVFVGGRTNKDTVFGEIIFSESYLGKDDEFKNDKELDVPFVVTPKSIVNKMMEMVNLKEGDYLIDLGCGDGRIVIEAAKRGAFGHGIDLDPDRVEEAWENAKTSNVLDRVSFMEGNVFDADFSQASVVSMYLLDSINVALRPKLFEQLKPGTRIVSHSFTMGDWEPDVLWNEGCHAVYSWIIPSSVNGNWSWEIEGVKYKMNVNQKYQKIQISVFENEVPMKVHEQVLNGEKIGFVVSHPDHENKFTFHGTVEGDHIKGSVRVQKGSLNSFQKWNAVR